VISTVAGTAGVASNRDGTNTFALLNFPTGIAADSAGRLYVADRNNHTIRELTPDGTNWIVATIAGTGSAGFKDGTNTVARFYHPNGIGVGTNGCLFVADADNNLIRLMNKVGTNWITQTIAGRTNVFYDTNKPPLYGPSGVVQAGSGTVYFLDQIRSSVRKLTLSGADWIVGDVLVPVHSGYADGTNNDAMITGPGGLAVDSGENIYLADSWNNAIRKAVQSGTNWVFQTIGGKTNYAFADGIGAAARFNYPNGVAVDMRGNVYVADASNNAVRRGTPLPVARASAMASGMLFASWDVAVGQVLQVQFATNLASPSWINMGGPVTMTNSTLTITEMTSDSAQRYYRVLVMP
jgi:sugar lactone lactonase YvrE